LDGSAAPFVQALQASGFHELPFSRAAFRIVHPFLLEDRGASIAFAPPGEEGCLEIAHSIEYDHPAIGVMAKSGPLTWEIFAREIAPARTFGFMKDFEGLKAQGLALGASFENTVVLDENGVVSGPLRYPDEFVRHKLLDLVGDLSLLGRPLSGRVTAVKTGHRLHLQAVRYFLDHPEFAAEPPAAGWKDESQ
jgi:UDP-3-O-[3-hydroxymyristoyl] N-acetylglucosamine deacetylase